MPRFVILRHDPPPGGARPLHWDFMLESDGVLRTWALDRPPDEGFDGVRLAESLADHRIAYLDFEGQISGGRGRITRWDQGDYNAIIWRNEQIVVDLHGARLIGRGRFELIDGPAHHWQFSFAPRLLKPELSQR